MSSVPPLKPDIIPPSTTSSDAAPSAGDDRRNLWENVLQQTFAAPDDAAAAVDPRTWGELQSLAGRYAGAMLCPEPILAEMIQIVLGSRFEQMVGSPRLMKELMSKISKTLWDDPISHGRVQTLWKRLSESPL